MAEAVEVMFVGLLTFLNINNDPALPSPRALLVRKPPGVSMPVHQAFVAYDATNTSVSGGNWQQLGMSKYFMMELDGISVDIGNDGAGPPSPQSSYNRIASLSQQRPGGPAPYWPNARPPSQWRSDCITAPAPSCLASWVALGGGTLEGGKRPSINWSFRRSNNQATSTGRYVREATYRFTSSDATIVLDLRDMTNPSAPVQRIVFSPRNPGNDVRIWIGNEVPGTILDAIIGKYPAVGLPGCHFVAFHWMTGDIDGPIPYPGSQKRKPGDCAEHAGHEGGDEMQPMDVHGGYCGPTSFP